MYIREGIRDGMMGRRKDNERIAWISEGKLMQIGEILGGLGMECVTKTDGGCIARVGDNS